MNVIYVSPQEWNTIQANVRRQKASSSTLSSSSASSSSTLSSLCFWREKRLIRPVLTTCGVMLFHRLSGAHAFNFYAVPIFRASFAGMDPHGAAVIVAFVQLLASITSGLLVDTVGRLPLLVGSNLFMTLALAAFGTFIYIEGKALLKRLSLSVSRPSTELHNFPNTTLSLSLGLKPILVTHKVSYRS